jgi:hypothetical protein
MKRPEEFLGPFFRGPGNSARRVRGREAASLCKAAFGVPGVLPGVALRCIALQLSENCLEVLAWVARMPGRTLRARGVGWWTSWRREWGEVGTHGRRPWALGQGAQVNPWQPWFTGGVHFCDLRRFVGNGVGKYYRNNSQGNYGSSDFKFHQGVGGNREFEAAGGVRRREG